MASAEEKIKESLVNVDLVIEVVDARAINYSSNKKFEKISKPFIRVALKSDIADVKSATSANNLIIGSTKNKKFKNELINKIQQFITPLIEKKKAKGIAKPTFYLMVVGLPNVGKSSLINFLASRRLAITGNRPAVTKRQAILKINDQLYLQDNPGIIFKDITEEKEGYILALLNTVKKEALPLNEVVQFGYEFLVKHYLTQLKAYYGFDKDLRYDEFIK
ncbi:MAG: 50S ribosome-binding GTPase [Mycoplasmoidaceae bacterium]|nr:50S ribosome-binding GTPase [Mycoplasmoidaceae bacterium]